MKAIVKPSKATMLMLGAETVQSHRPSVVTYTDYIESRVAKGEIKVLEKELSDDASDSPFEKIWNVDQNDVKAIKTYMETFKKPEEKK